MRARYAAASPRATRRAACVRLVVHLDRAHRSEGNQERARGNLAARISPVSGRVESRRSRVHPGRTPRVLPAPSGNCLRPARRTSITCSRSMMGKTVRARRANAYATPVYKRRRGTRPNRRHAVGARSRQSSTYPARRARLKAGRRCAGCLANRRHTLCSHLCRVALYVAACFRLCRR
jgi:hypothetical protein